MANFTIGNFDGLTFADNGIVSQLINVYGVSGAVTSVSVKLGGLSHGYLDDLDMLLEAPDGASNLVFWSDAGGSSVLDPSLPGSFTISDSASTDLLDNNLPSRLGSYRPADYGVAEVRTNFGAASSTINHAGPNGASTFASAFGGIDGNGEWKLYVADDTSNDTGRLKNWSIEITTEGNFAAVSGGAGNDTIRVNSFFFNTGSYQLNEEPAVLYSGVDIFRLDGGGGNDTIFGSQGGDSHVGGAGRDTIRAQSGDDVIEIVSTDDVAGETYDGGLGVDQLTTFGGGSYTVNLRDDVLNSFERVSFGFGVTGAIATILLNADQFGEGISLSATIVGTTGDQFSFDPANLSDRLDIAMGSTTTITLAGLAFEGFSEAGDQVLIRGDSDAEIIVGSAAADWIDGGGGTDRMTGLGGNDTYVTNGGDTIIEAVGGGTDLVLSSVTHVLAANIENLTLTGAFAIDGTGNALANVITGNSAANLLSGGVDALADVLIGGLGNDTYVINSATDDITELAGGGTADRAKASVSFTLAAGDNIEFLETTNAAAATAINLTGNEIAQTITGNAGANILNGGVDALIDVLIGGLGNDTYVINTATDNIVELAGGGTADRAKVSVSFALAAGDNIEFLETTEPAALTAINLTGNEIAQTITGNAGANILNGGVDVLIDVLIGGLGNDTYVINTATDNIVELAGGGTGDRAKASVSFTLAAGDNIEFLETTNAAAATAINLTGNEIAQTIIGNAGANTLNGGIDALVDVLIGGLGNDTYVINTATDNIVELAGGGTADRAKASVSFTLAIGDNVEFLETTNAAAVTAINLTGNEVAQTITGNAGANILKGGLGLDILIGGLGVDRFAFDNAVQGLDTITDFAHLTDDIQIDASGFGGGLAAGAMAANRLVIGAAGGTPTANQGFGQFLYDVDDGRLFWDPNGNLVAGGAIHIATLSGAPVISVADFVVIP